MGGVCARLVLRSLDRPVQTNVGSEATGVSAADDWPSTKYTLLRGIRDLRNEDAWTTFVDLYTPLVYRFCRRRGLQDADARNVVQEVFIRVSRGICRFDPAAEKGRFRSWLGTIIYREIQRERDKARQPGRGAGGNQADVAIQQIEAQFVAEWEATFDAEVYQYALDRVRSQADADSWGAFEAVWMNNQKPRQVADRLNKSVDWVYKAKYKVLSRLRNEIRYLTSELAELWEQKAE